MSKVSGGTASAGGSGTLGLLGVLFVVLKLYGVINWSWWWVLAPFWIPSAVVAIVATAVLVIYFSVNGLPRRKQ